MASLDGIEGGARDLVQGVLLIVAGLAFCLLCFVGAWTVAVWAWGLA